MYTDRVPYLCLLCGFLTVFVSVSESIMFHLPPGGQKCLREELRQNVLISGEYDVSEAPGQRVNYVVHICLDNLSFSFSYIKDCC